MATQFLMDRRARASLTCEGCDSTIAAGERWIWRRHKVGSYWEKERLCSDCCVFGPDHNPWTLPPNAPD